MNSTNKITKDKDTIANELKKMVNDTDVLFMWCINCDKTSDAKKHKCNICYKCRIYNRIIDIGNEITFYIKNL